MRAVLVNSPGGFAEGTRGVLRATSVRGYGSCSVLPLYSVLSPAIQRLHIDFVTC